MEDEGDLQELLAIDISQLGCIDELLNNDVLAIDDTTKGGSDQVLELGFEADTVTNNNEYIPEEYSHDNILERFNQQLVMNSDVGLDVAVDTAISIPTDGVRDNLKSDTIFKPTKTRKKQCRWTEEEHRQMKKAFKDGLMGQWKKISELYIPTKTGKQITSHAQKYLLRRNNRQKKRKSINDYDSDTDDNDMSYEVHHDQPSDHLIPPTRPSARDVINNTVYHQQEVVRDPSSSAMSSMVNYQSHLQLQSPMPPPLMTPPTPMHGRIMKMPPPVAYDNDAVALYYANQYLLLEEQKNMMMMMMMMRKSRHDMMTMAPINGLLPGAGYSSNGSLFGVDQLEPYNYNVGSSSNTTAHHHDAYYNNGNINAPLDQWVLQPEPLAQQFGHDHHHIVLPPSSARSAGSSGRPTNCGY